MVDPSKGECSKLKPPYPEGLVMMMIDLSNHRCAPCLCPAWREMFTASSERSPPMGSS